MNLVELLEKFRSSEYHYPDVIWHEVRAKKLKEIISEKLVGMTRDEFKNLLLSNLFMKPRIPEQTINDIISQNDFVEVKRRINSLFLGTGSIKERIQSVMDLKGVGPYLASQLVAAVGDDEYAVYHPKVVEGMKELLPHLDDWQFFNFDESTAEGYLWFNEICKAVKKIFNFKSLGEVHEFFWHGHDSKWEFR
ncbi:MAG: hypothetical protein QXN95_01375 [Candidatus Bathyarchaeia archaeon]